jgi:RNA ligase (TIGR02306 family)
MRNLVTTRLVTALTDIPGADNIVCATVDGWKVVVKKGEFAVGDQCLFFEIDSFLPAADTRFDFLAKTKRTWRGKDGYRLRTIKLKKQISQGLALPVAMFPEGLEALTATIEKWEEDIPAALAGQVKGTFPAFLRKTDQERIQNCYQDIDKRGLYEVTIKMDGTSLTVYHHEGIIGVCSRNQELKINDENAGNLYVQQVPTFKDLPEGYAVQAEVCGPGIQGNRAGLDRVQTFVFDIYDIKAGAYLPWHLRRAMCEKYGWQHVPSIVEPTFGPHDFLESMDAALAYAERWKYLNGEPAEGIVCKSNDGSSSFKIISNAFLLKHGL